MKQKLQHEPNRLIGSNVTVSSNPIASSIDDLAIRAMRLQGIPGLSITVYLDDHQAFARAYGSRNLGEQLPTRVDTTFRIASVSKQFTAAAVLRLAERGKVSIDDAVSTHIPWFKYSADVRIRHLLTHTSGIPGYTERCDFDRLCLGCTTYRAAVEPVLRETPAFSPGDDWQYSNTNYMLLGLLIEEVAQKTYPDFLNSEFFIPLGLTHTTAHNSQAILSNHAEGYTSFCLGPYEKARDWHHSWYFATGSLRSTTGDIVRWSRALRAGAVLSETSTSGMMQSTRLNDGRDAKYGFGLVSSELVGLREVRHTGGLPGVSTDHSTYPDLDLDIAVFANVDGISVYNTLIRRIVALVLERKGFKAPMPVGPLPAVSPRVLKGAVTTIERLIKAPGSAKITQRLHRFLTPQRLDELRGLSSLGKLQKLTLLDTGRRHPLSSFSYRADFHAGSFLVTLQIRDGNRLNDFSLRPWDERW